MAVIQFASDMMYTRDIHGNVIQWAIDVGQNPDNTAMIHKSYGRVGGKIHTNGVTITEGKNIGRSNETTPTKQAIKEAKADVTRKTKEGYRSLKDLEVILANEVHHPNLLSVLEAKIPKVRLDANNFSKPMKAQPFKSGKITFGYAQPKINGVRAFVSYRHHPNPGLFSDGKEIIISSKNGIIYNIPHLAKRFKTMWEMEGVPQDIVFDGEIYIKGKAVTTIGGAAKNINNILNPQLGFVCFDLAIPEMAQVDRLQLKTKFLGCALEPHSTEDTARIFNLPSLPVNEEEFARFTQLWLDNGYEGGIIRDVAAVYRFGSRPVTMMKLKKFIDKEYKLVSILPTERDVDKHGRPLAMFLCVDAKTNELFSVTPHGYSKEERAELLINKTDYIGKDITVKFYEYTDKGLPFHANGHIRDYE